MFKVIEQNITQHILYNTLITPFPYVRNDRWLMINLNQISMINCYFSEKNCLPAIKNVFVNIEIIWDLNENIGSMDSSF